MIKKKVIAYVHTHWDREWYREFEVFRLRLLRVFDNVLEMLEKGLLPSFYFDGQVCALLDYLKFRPEKEELVRKFIKEKKLFIGPFYTLVDEFLCDDVCFRKNLEIGLKISKDFGCKDFIAYFADTFGHSQNIVPILKEYGLDKCVVWRGVPKNLHSEFIYNGLKTVNLVRGYFMDIFSADVSIEKKVDFLKKNLDLIAAKSSNTLLLPIGADHLGVPTDLMKQIEEVNEHLVEYEIVLDNPFAYFDAVKNSYKERFDGELRDNSATFILPGAYSARRDLKQYFNQASYRLKLADDFQKKHGAKYEEVVEYAYKLLLKNLAHDSICGCSTDDVHQENIVRYKKVLQIAETIVEELKLEGHKFELSGNFEEFESLSDVEGAQVVSYREGFEKSLLYDVNKIPVTEDYKTIYTLIKEKTHTNDVLKVTDFGFGNFRLLFFVKEGGLCIRTPKTTWRNFIEFIRCKDVGDTYNFAPDLVDEEKVAQIISSEVIMRGNLRVGIRVTTSFFDVDIYLNKNSKMVNFKISGINELENTRWQVRFNLPEEVDETYSEDMGQLVKRRFNPNYELKNALPKTKGVEAKTDTAPMQRFVWAKGLGIVTKGLTEYEVKKNTVEITLLRGCNIISNPKNPARTTPAGPPIPLKDAQLIGYNEAEFSIALCDVEDYKKLIDEVYPQVI